jgi:glycosyltransferase involved in cell wall biosynthesis
MRIAFCTDILPPVVDGVTRTLRELVPTLLDSGVDLLFVSAVEADGSYPWRDRVHTIGSVPFPSYRSYRVGLPVPFSLDPVLDRFAPDVVHVVTPSLLGLYGVRYGRRRGVPVVASFHTNFVTLSRYYGLGWLQWLVPRLMRRFYNQCAVTLVPSQSIADMLRGHGVRKVALWQRGVSPERFSPAFRSAALRARLDGGAPILLYVGRLAKEKNLEYLVAAVRQLESWRVSFKLVVVGEGPMRAQLERDLPAAQFAGYVPPDQLGPWYASADLFVFPSCNETFGNVVLEAFASGLPVVAVNEGGVRELVTPGRGGVLAPPEDPVAFASEIRDLLAQPERRARLGEQAQAAALGYRWPEVTERLLDCYVRVIAEHSHATDYASAVALR